MHHSSQVAAIKKYEKATHGTPYDNSMHIKIKLIGILSGFSDYEGDETTVFSSDQAELARKCASSDGRVGTRSYIYPKIQSQKYDDDVSFCIKDNTGSAL